MPKSHRVQQATQRLLLRELNGDDVDAVHAIYGSPQATEHLSFEPRTREQVESIVEGAIASAAVTPRSEYALGICEKDSGQLIGFGRLALDPHAQQAATIGFALRPASWGVGYGTETVRALLVFGFNQLGLHRIWAARSPANTASEKALLRAGMTEEGRLHDHVHVRGAWRDSITYYAISGEWDCGGAGG